MIRLLLKNYINILFENDYWNSAYYRCTFMLQWQKKYNTDLETINPPMTKKERKALMFYRKTKCNWGGDYSDEEMDGAIEQISYKEYIEYLRSISKSKD